MVTLETATQDLLTLIAHDEKIPLERMQGIIKKLHEEWYDTAGSMKDLSLEDMQRMGIPSRVATALMRKLREIAVPRAASTPQSRGNALSDLLGAVGDRAALVECVRTCQAIVYNIVGNPTDQRLWEIRLNNQKFQQRVGRFPMAMAYLEHLGFVKEGNVIRILDLNYGAFLEALKELNSAALGLGLSSKDPPAPQTAPSAPAFDPYKSISISTNLDIPRVLTRENDPAVYTAQIQALSQAKEALIRQQSVSRSPVIYHLPADFSSLSLRRAALSPDSEETITPEDENLMLQTMQSLLRANEENSRFQNKRKRQLEQAARRKVFTKVAIKVRFPDATMVQGTFSPLETTLDLHRFIQSLLADQQRRFYLYLTPPKEILQPSQSDTLERMAPATLLYFAWDQESECYIGETTVGNGPFLSESALQAAVPFPS